MFECQFHTRVVSISDGYAMEDVIMYWKAGKESVRGVEQVELPQFTIVEYKTISTVQHLATGRVNCILAHDFVMNSLFPLKSKRLKGNKDSFSSYKESRLS